MPKISPETMAAYRSVMKKIRRPGPPPAAGRYRPPVMPRGRLCVHDTSKALRAYAHFTTIAKMLTYRPDDKDLHGTILRQMLPAGRFHLNDFSQDLESLGGGVHKAVGALCKKNAKQLWSRIGQLKAALRKGNVELAVKKATAAAGEASMCASTIVEFCAPISRKRKRELIAASKKK